MPSFHISRDAYMMGRDRGADTPTEEMEVNCTRLLHRVHRLLYEYSGTTGDLTNWTVSSGYRPASANKAAGGSARSAHLTCEAIDIADPAQKLQKWIVSHIAILNILDLYMEHESKTPTWVHLQIRPTASGNRRFLP